MTHVTITLAQDIGTKGVTGNNENIFSGSKTTTNPLKELSSSAVTPVERLIEPNEYLLGPSDQFLLNIPAFDDASIPIMVSADNTIVLPRGLGLVNLKGKNLSQLRITVDSLFKMRSKNLSNVSITLLKPRAIYVTVSGFVRNSGRYILSATDRVSTALAFANQIQKEDKTKISAPQEFDKYAIQDKGESKPTNDFYEGEIAPRKILVRRNNGETEWADMAKYRAFGESKYNPLLREGDEIIVSKYDISKQLISIVGEVNSPTVIPFSNEDNLNFLLKVAGGATEDADLTNGIISSVTEAGIINKQINFADSSAISSIVLSGGEQIVIPRKPANMGRKAGVVTISGEVNKPQVLPIINGVTKLSEAIKQAQGFTNSASLQGAYIIRERSKNLFDADRTAETKVSELANSPLRFEDSTRFKYDRKLQRNRVSVDFVELFKNNNSAKDIFLYSGDEIFIPSNPHNIYVRGRVLRPGWVEYKPGEQVDYYIKLAGGATDAAVIDRTIVQKFGTGAWDIASKVTISEGDEIYVPGESDIPARTAFEQISTTVGFVSGIAGIIGALVNIYIQLSNR